MTLFRRQVPTGTNARRRSAVLASLVVLLLLRMTSTSSAAATTTSDPDAVHTSTSTAIDAFVEERLGALGIPGAAVAVVRDGAIVHLAGYGMADPHGREVTSSTTFLIGSISKVFTATAVMQLVGDGLLALDEPVLPHLGHSADEAPDGFAQVTVGELLNHTGGLSMANGLAGTNEIHRGADPLGRRVSDLLTQPLSNKPGTKFEYSNADPVILAEVLERVTGQSFDDYLQGHVFGPLGMSGSFASPASAGYHDLATGHQLWFNHWRPVDFPYDVAGAPMGYIGSSAKDLAAFMLARLDSQPSEVFPTTLSQISRERVVRTGWKVPLESRYGLGWFVDETAGQQIISHSGSLGNYSGQVVLAPGAHHLGIAVVTNASAFIAAGHRGQYDLSLGLTRLLLGQEPQPTDRSPTTAIVYPILTWCLVMLIPVEAGWYLSRGRRKPTRRPKRQSPWWIGLLPGLLYLTLGLAILLLAPLASARYFYPDVGWGATILAAIATTWGLTRLGVTTAATRMSPSLRRRRGPRRPPPRRFVDGPEQLGDDHQPLSSTTKLTSLTNPTAQRKEVT